MFLLISSGHIWGSKQHRPWKPSLCFLDIQFVYQNCTQIWRLHTKLYNGTWNVLSNNSETVGDIDLRLGQNNCFYISVFCEISFSWLLLQDGFNLFFVPCLLGDSENDLIIIVFYFFSALLMFHTATWCSSLLWQAQELILLMLPLWVKNFPTWLSIYNSLGFKLSTWTPDCF